VGILQQHGVTAIGRYYSTAHPGRVLTKAEAEEVSRANILMWAVYEDHGRPTLTQAQGLADGQAALQQAQAVGQPQDTAIYFAVEGLPNGYDVSDLPAIRDYFSGVKSAIGNAYKLGVYSDGVVCKDLQESGTCAFTWLSASNAFPGTHAYLASRKWAIHQTLPLDQDWNGLSIDPDEVNGDFGSFVVPIPVG
jgi:hypothetical protein